MSVEESNPFKGLNNDPLPEGEWQRQLKEAATKFNKENPPYPPLEPIPPIEEIAPKAVISPDKLAPQPNAGKLREAEDNERQRRWYDKFLRNK